MMNVHVRLSYHELLHTAVLNGRRKDITLILAEGNARDCYRLVIKKMF